MPNAFRSRSLGSGRREPHETEIGCLEAGKVRRRNHACEPRVAVPRGQVENPESQTLPDLRATQRAGLPARGPLRLEGSKSLRVFASQSGCPVLSSAPLV